MAILTRNYIESFIKSIDSYLQKEEGRKFLDDNINSSKKVFSADAAIKAAEDLKRMIITYAQSEFTLSQFSIYQSVHNIDVLPPIKTSTGKYIIELKLYGDLRRPSLNSSNPGAEDIVGLFIHGWEDKNDKIKKLFGVWHGEMVKARTRKDPINFVSNAVDMFNMKYEPIGLYAEIGDDYK